MMVDSTVGGQSAWFHVIAIAAILTVLNSIKPVHNDDVAYLTYGREFAAHPLNPYAFDYGTPLNGSANLTLVPPVLPYWLAAGFSLLGDSPFLLKLWLF